MSRDNSATAAARADLTERAEILWCLQVAAAGYPYHTANNTGILFLIETNIPGKPK